MQRRGKERRGNWGYGEGEKNLEVLKGEGNKRQTNKTRFKLKRKLGKSPGKLGQIKTFILTEFEFL